MGFEEDIKRPFEGPSFEFREEYWQAAQRMIDRDFRRRRWLRALWITAGVGLVSGSLILGWVRFGDSASQKERQPASLPHPIAHTEQRDERPGQMAREISPATTADRMPTEDAGKPATGSTGLAGSTESGSGSGHSDRTDRLSSHRRNKAATGGPASRQADEASGVVVDTRDMPAVPYTSDRATARRNIEETDRSRKESRNFVATPVDRDTASRSGLTALPVHAEEHTADTRSMASSQTTIGLQDQMAHTGVGPVAPLEPLSIALVPVKAQAVPANSLPLVAAAEVQPGAIAAVSRKSRFYAVAESMQYPGGDPQAMRWLGLNAGVAWQQPIGRMLFVETGLRAAVRRGSYDASQISNQLDFDFGPRDNAYILRPKAVYSVQIPLLIGAELGGRHQVSAGVLPAFLLGVRGTSEYGRYVHSWEGVTPGDDRVYEVLDKGWIDTDGFRKFALTYALRYQFRWTDRLSIGLSAQYMPKDWIGADFGKFYNFDTNSYEVPNASGGFLVERNWIMGVELRYAF